MYEDEDKEEKDKCDISQHHYTQRFFGDECFDDIPEHYMTDEDEEGEEELEDEDEDEGHDTDVEQEDEECSCGATAASGRRSPRSWR